MTKELSVDQVELMNNIIRDNSEEFIASINFTKLQNLCRGLRGQNTHDIRLTQPKKILCAYVRSHQDEAQQIVQAAVEMTQFDRVFMRTCQNSESIGPLLVFCNYLIRDYMIHHADGGIRNNYQDYVRRQGCSAEDTRCRDCATIKFVIQSPVAPKIYRDKP